jgi:tetratricopeptide (TPR) repeat protein
MAVEDAIAEIKKEIIESHNLIIKTDNLVKNLSSEIRQVQKKQERYERKYIFNSVVAYVIFVVVIFGGLYVAFDAKVAVVRREKETLEESLAKAQSEVKELQGKLSFRSQQEKTTERFLQLKQENRPLDALKVVEALDSNRLSPVLARLVTRESEELRLKLANDALEAGKILYQKAHLNKSLRELNRALEVKPQGELLSKVYHQRAIVLLKLNRNAQAAESFLAAADADTESGSTDNLLFMAAGTMENSGDVPRALEVYERLLKNHPKSPYASQARRRIARLTGKKASLEVKPPKPETEEDSGTKPKPGSGTTTKPVPKPKPESVTPEGTE